MRSLTAFAAPYRAHLVAAMVAAVVAAALDGFVLALLIPFLRLLFGASAALPGVPTAVERLVALVAGDLLVTGSVGAALRNVAVLILLAVACKNAALYAAEYLGRVTQESVTHDLRTTLFDRLQAAELSAVVGARRGQVIVTATADAEQVGAIMGTALITGVRQAGLILVYVAILAALSARLTFVTVALAPLVLLALMPVLRSVRARTRAAAAERGELSAVLVETLDGARVVRTHGAERVESARFRAVSHRFRDRVLAAQRTALLASPLSETLGAGVIVLLLLAGTSWALSGAMRPEVFVAFVVLSLRLLSPAKKLTQYPAQVAQARAAMERLATVMELPMPEPDPATATRFPGIQERITLDRVWFAYHQGQWVLRDVSCQIARGEVVALVGPSGAGKSTLADLLPRFIEPGRGSITVDGIPLGQFTRESLRRAVGVVSQETVVFNDTVFANIAYGDARHATPDQVEAAARLAHAHEFIGRLPDGYNTRLGERGCRLSGGERQRLSIARALLRDPPLLILDEATAHLDAVSERLVQEALEQLFDDRTVLVIAHRLSTVRRADRILVLDGGTIVEDGSHESLLAADGLYRELYRMQLSQV